MVQVELSKIIIDEKRQDQIIVLREKGSERQFPIVIGFLEASSIKLKLSGKEPPRPMTHDLLVSVIDGLHATVERMVIDKMLNNTFHAKLELLTPDEEMVSIDARPSDGIAVSVRTGSPIYVADEVFEKASFINTE